MMKNLVKSLSAAFLAAFAPIFLAPANAQTGPEYVQTGVLSCDISAGIGLIIGSNKEVTCLFKPVNNAPQTVYIGAIRKFGLDLGATGAGQMIWSVYSPTTAEFSGLAGRYAGAGAEATVVAGLGANVLLGGSYRTVALQPVSVQGQVGLNIAVGVEELELRPVQ
jgi:hypothetical protein